MVCAALGCSRAHPTTAASRRLPLSPGRSNVCRHGIRGGACAKVDPAVYAAQQKAKATAKANAGLYPECAPPDTAGKCSKLNHASKCKGSRCCRPKPAADLGCVACGVDGRCSTCIAG